MKKKVSKVLFALCSFIPCSLMLSACGEGAKLTDLTIDFLNNTYIIENNTITVEWGENLNELTNDFVATAIFSDNSTKVLSETEKGYAVETTIPTSSQDNKTPIGNYTITFSYNGQTEVINVNVVEKIVNLSNLTWTDSSNFVYDGTQKTVEITSTLPEYVSVSYSNNIKTDAGSYTTTATFTCLDEHYALSTTTATYSWNIAKADIDVSAVALENATYTYNGEERNVTLVGVPENIEANIISGGSATNAGEYTAVVEFNVNNNFNKPQNKELVWNIAKADVDISAVALENATYTYNGEERNVTLVNVPENIEANIISGGSATNAGEYTAVVEFNVNNNFNKPQNKELTWKIDKQYIDVSEVYIEEDTFAYDGEEKTVTLVGVPENVEANIVNGSSATQAGAYFAEVEFSVSDNYYKPANISLSWNILSVNIENVRDYIIRTDSEYSYYFKLTVNNEEQNLYLNDCVSEEQISDFNSQNFSNGDTYTFTVKYLNLEQDIIVTINNYNIKDIKFENERTSLDEFLTNKENNSVYITVIDNAENSNYVNLSSDNLEIVSIIDSQNNNIVFENINSVGSYTFTFKYLISSKYDEKISDYINIYSEEIQAVLTIVENTAVKDFWVQNSNILVGEKPLFNYNTFDNQEFYELDILDNLSYDINEFNYTNAGEYETEFTFDGYTKKISINVHNSFDVENIYLNQNSYIIGSNSSLKVYVNTWGNEQYSVDLEDSYITSGSLDLTKEGTYNIQITYGGVSTYETINVVDSNAVSNIYLSNNVYELNTNKKITFTVYYYNNNFETVELSQDMLYNSEMPDLTTVGLYNFSVRYKGFVESYYIEVYDPQDTTIKNIRFLTSSKMVFNYTIENDEVNFIENLEGNFIKIERANKQTEIINITSDMISYDKNSVKQQILDNRDFITSSLTLSYENLNLYGYGDVVFIELDSMEDFASNSYISLIKNGVEENKIIVEINNEVEDYYLSYYYNGYTYYQKIENNNILNLNNEIQTTDVAGAYDVTVNGYNTILFVFDKADAEINFYSNKVIQVVVNSSKEDLLNALIGNECNAYISYNYGGSYYNDSQNFIISKDNIGDISELNLTKVENIKIDINYNGFEGYIYIQVIPNIDGQTPSIYSYEDKYGNTSTISVYEEYVTYNSIWYKYEVVDAENNIILIDNSQGRLLVIDYDNKLITDFKGENLVNAVEKEYSLNYSGQQLVVKTYNDIYADVYGYDQEDLKYISTYQIVKTEEDSNFYYNVSAMNLKVLIDDVNHVLTPVVGGELVYTYEDEVEMNPGESQLVKAEFREENGEKLMYFYSKNTETNEYELLGTLIWEINTEHTLITCYTDFGGQLIEAVTFTVENEQVTSMQMLTA